MAITTSTGYLDPTLGYILPNSNSTWNATSGTTWDNFLNWNIAPADPLIWVTEVFDFGRVGYFNIAITSRFVGDLTKFEIWTSTTGAFAGEETLYTVNDGDSNIVAFYGRYVRVGAWVYRAGHTTKIEDLTIKLSNQALELDIPDVNSRDLPTWSAVDTTATVANAYVLDLGRPVSQVLSVHYQPHFIAPGPYMSVGYATTGYVSEGYRMATQYEYFEEIDYGAVCQATIVKKTVHSSSLTNQVGTVFMLQDQNGDYIHNTVDVRAKVLPEQYMQNGQLLAR